MKNGNMGLHSAKEQRYWCDVCQTSFSATKGTIFYRLRTNAETVMLVIALLVYGCPLQAFCFDERTVKEWWRRVGQHCHAVHAHTVGSSSLDLQQVQADEI